VSEAVQVKAVPTKPLKTTHLMKRIISYALLALVFFLLGFLRTWVKSLESFSSLIETGHQLSLARMQNSLASAVIDVQRGNYAPALQSASSFFTSLRAETDRGSASAFSPAQISSVQPLFAQRDEIITLLARSDPAAGARLSDLYAAYRQIING
jgi:hypothetical protein